MTNIELLKVESFGQIVEHIVITNEDGSQIGMTKAHYDEQQAAVSQTRVQQVDEAEAK